MADDFFSPQIWFYVTTRFQQYLGCQDTGNANTDCNYIITQSITQLNDFVTIIEELILILRECKYIFTTKRQNIIKIKQDSTVAWVRQKHFLFCEIFSIFFMKDRRVLHIPNFCAKQLIDYRHRQRITGELLTMYVLLNKYLDHSKKQILLKRNKEKKL